MKNKYLALFVAVILCFTFLFGTVATALDIEIPPETIEGALEGVLGEDPGVVGDEIKDGIYEGRDFLQMVTQAIDNLKIILTNFLAKIFEAFGIGESKSIFG